MLQNLGHLKAVSLLVFNLPLAMVLLISPIVDFYTDIMENKSGKLINMFNL